MSDTKGQHEPSMEEILASIRRIIAEDGDGAAPAANGTAPAAAADAGDDEILELTDVVEPDEAMPAVKPEPEPIAIEPPREPHRPKPEEPATAEEPTGEAPIVSAATAALSVAAMSRITELSQQRAERDIPLGAGQVTLEALVRQELRPILREWLDANLPDMVERIVKSEIARLVQNVSKR